MTDKYGDIIGLPHHVSAVRRGMTQRDRAAQFAPFAALSGYGDDVAESARSVAGKIELDEYETAEIDMKLRILHEAAGRTPEVTVTYFIPDKKKSGGSYVSVNGAVTKIDDVKQLVLMESGETIPFDDIYAINDILQ